MRIIYLDIDSLRPDHMSCYGYERQTTPSIDKIATRGVRFQHAYCASSPCVPSRASFISGRFAINHGALSHWGPGCHFEYPEGPRHSQIYPLFTRYLRKAGYKTITFSSFGDRHHAWWFFGGWNEVHTFTLKVGTEHADEVNAAAIPWLRAYGREEDYFLHIQYWDPHTMYTYPSEYAEQFADQPAKDFPDEETIREHQTQSHPHSASFLYPYADRTKIPPTMPFAIGDRADFKKLVDGYDGGINYMDQHVGQLLEVLHELNIEDEVGFIISADHGESMGEHGIYAEHASATESVHHIPLIITLPGITKPGIVNNQFVYNVDVIATLTELLGLPVPEGWDGRSFLPALAGEEEKGRDYLVMDHGLYTCQRSVRDKRWYFIRTYHAGLYAFDPVILHDMDNDPHQQVNVAGQYPEIVQLMDHRIGNWTHEYLGQPGPIVDPLQECIQSGPWRYIKPSTWMQRLRSEGWDEQANRLAKRYGR
jgi:choline-sulfatase